VSGAQAERDLRLAAGTLLEQLLESVFCQGLASSEDHET
jgi:hypothetical protein